VTAVEPRVAVVIPAWDAYAREGLREAVASVRSQTTPVQLIVVDNASRVPLPALGSIEIVALEPRRSTGAARNAALTHVRTPYVVFLDADDVLLPGALSSLVQGLDEDSECSAYVLSIMDGVTGARYRSPRRLGRLLSGCPRLFALANATWSLVPTQGAAIMRTADVRACGGYGDSSRGEDWVLAASLAFRGRVSFDHRLGLCYRRRADSPGEIALSAAVLLQNARRVRERLRDDPAIPGWATSALRLIAAAQWTAACIAYPTRRSVRGLLGAVRQR
jgi:glycosyltransferase involved in cell wall biosynthesis